MQMILDGKATTERSVLALGMFDGVHLGHQVLLERAKNLAAQAQASLVACTFLTHPMELIAPEKSPPMLTTLEERARIIEECGADILYAQPFDGTTMNQSPEAYIAELCRRFHPRFIVVGYDFTFGKDGSGDAELLSALGQVFGFSAEVVPQITYGGQEISSSAIRRLLDQGDVNQARILLGRPYARQAVAAGQEKGRALLVMEPNGKQNVGQGEYRVSLAWGEQVIPACITVYGEGRVKARLPKAPEPGTGITLRFYHGKG